MLQEEAALAVQARQDAAGVRASRERLRHRAAEPGEERGLEQDRLRLGGRLRHDLVGEVIDDAVRSAPPLDGQPAPLLQHQHEPGRPAPGPLVKRRRQRRRRRGRQPLEQRPGLGRAQAQLGPVDLTDGAIGAQPCEGRRRLGAAGDHDAAAARQLAHRLAQGRVHGRVARHVVVTVEDEHGRAPPIPQRPEELPRKIGGGGGAVGGEARQPAGAGRASQIVEERREIVVPAVAVVPEGRQAPRLEIGGDERRLAGAWRRPHPGDRTAAVQALKEPRARQHAAQPGSGDLRERHPSLVLPLDGRRSRTGVPSDHGADVAEQRGYVERLGEDAGYAELLGAARVDRLQQLVSQTRDDDHGNRLARRLASQRLEI